MYNTEPAPPITGGAGLFYIFVPSWLRIALRTDSNTGIRAAASASSHFSTIRRNCLIKRIDVYRDYRLHIDFNIDLEQFGLGLDIIAA